MRKRAKNWEDLLHLDYRWPKKGDRLFPKSDEWSNREVDFSGSPTSRHVHQWTGYMAAGAGLIELCTQEGYEHERHFVIYPILFNYRHGLELAMKWIIFNYGGQGIHGIDKDHDLWKLWKRCRTIVEQYKSEQKEAIQAVEQVVKDFHDFDKSSMAFRYGWDKDGKEFRLPEHAIHLDNIRDVMEGVAGYFDSLDGWLRDLQSSAPGGAINI